MRRPAAIVASLALLASAPSLASANFQTHWDAYSAYPQGEREMALITGLPWECTSMTWPVVTDGGGAMAINAQQNCAGPLFLRQDLTVTLLRRELTRAGWYTFAVPTPMASITVNGEVGQTFLYAPLVLPCTTGYYKATSRGYGYGWDGSYALDPLGVVNPGGPGSEHDENGWTHISC